MSQEPSRDTYTQPRPRPTKPPAHTAQLRIQNRRRQYLELNPAYFHSLDHELTDTLLYDKLVRQFQTAAEREAEGRKKGYSRVLEVDLLRGEAKLSELAKSVQDSNDEPRDHQIPARERDIRRQGVIEDETSSPASKEEGLLLWKDFLSRRFINGEDEDFKYWEVDENDEYDILERQEREQAWFDDEAPGWISDKGDESEGYHKKSPASLQGETGIQDF